MKTQYLTAVAIATVLAATIPAHAGEKELVREQVPKVVIEAFEKAHPAAKHVEYEREMFGGKVAFEIEYKDNDKEYELLYSEDGALLQMEEEIDVHSLPEAVSKAIAKTYPQAKIAGAEKLTKPDGTLTGYEVDIETQEKKLELKLDAGGKILEIEEDD